MYTLLRNVLFQWKYFPLMAGLLLAAEAFLGQMIIQRVPYTEIDWRAYMQEVEGVLGGEWDYQKLRGDTGPLVYPAGFVYLFMLFRAFTDQGTNIFKAQQIWFCLYLLTTFTVFKIYRESGATPPYVLFLLSLSKRVHSLFLLRLFNDCVAMFLAYLSIFFFTRNRWSLGCFIYSLAVSIKMNVLLFAPGLLLLLLWALGPLRTIPKLMICASVQVVLAVPFLWENWLSYLAKAFELSRVFMFKWTVNWKFLPEEVFLSKSFALTLLCLHLLFLAFFLLRWTKALRGEAPRRGGKEKGKKGTRRVSPSVVTAILFISNFIGICFARTIHYQFYCWYYHSLPFLLWQTSLPFLIKLGLMGGIEYAYNVYPATPLSSSLLQGCHFLLLFSLLYQAWSTPRGPRTVLTKKQK